MRLRFSPIVILAFLITLLELDASAQVQQLWHRSAVPLKSAPVTWSSANENLSKELETAAIGNLAQQALRDPAAASPAQWLRRLALLTRAEYRRDVLQMLKSRPRFMPAALDWRMDGLANEALTYGDLEMARAVCERYPEGNFGSFLIGRIVASLPAGEADTWLAKRAGKGDGPWLEARLRLRSKEGTEAPLLMPFEQSVRAHPADLEAVVRYLWAVAATGKKQDVSWLSYVCRPKLAVEALVLGQTLAALDANPSPVLERSLGTPFSPEDNTWYQAYLQRVQFAYIMPTRVITEPQLRRQTKQALMTAYKKSGREAKAQALLEELTAGNPGGLPGSGQGRQAGQIQNLSGERTIESRIRAAENDPGTRDSVDYWLERGQYFSARKEDKEARAAFEKALTLAPLPKPDRPTRRLQILFAYDRHLWLQNVDRPIEAVALMHHELEAVPLDTEYADSIVSEMLSYERDNTHLIDPADKRLWDFLAAKASRTLNLPLLRRLVENTATADRDAVWTRAEVLTKTAPVESVFALGEMMLYLNASHRAIPLLKQAAALSAD